MIRDQLLSSCDEEVANLFEIQLDNKTEEQLLIEMRRLAVINQNRTI